MASVRDCCGKCKYCKYIVEEFTFCCINKESEHCHTPRFFHETCDKFELKDRFKDEDEDDDF